MSRQPPSNGSRFAGWSALVWILAGAFLVNIALAASVYFLYPQWIRRTTPLDEKGWLGLLSNDAGRRWLDEGRLIGLDVPALKAAFGDGNVRTEGPDRGPDIVTLSYDSDVLAEIVCKMKDGVVVSAYLHVP